MKRTTSKKIAFLGLLTAAAVLFGYVEFLIPLDFIAPGVKLGIANCVSLLLICVNEKKWAVAVNAVRIIICALIFSNLFSLIFSFSAGMISVMAMCLLSYSKKCGIIGLSVTGACIHNVVQIAVAYLTVGKGVIFYLPLLVASAIITGIILAVLSYFIINKLSFTKVLED